MGGGTATTAARTYIYIHGVYAVCLHVITVYHGVSRKGVYMYTTLPGEIFKQQQLGWRPVCVCVL